MILRVRFAPSPTGYLHVGSARTALFNWLVARGSGGTFVLRSDDTDRERSDAAYQADILEGLRWLGLDWDEGVEVGGPHGSYRQSDRLDRYQAAAGQLREARLAYPCFCTSAELEERRDKAMEAGLPPGYDGRCRLIDPDEAARRLEAGEEASIRFAVPRPGSTVFHDLVRDEVSFDHDHVDDFVILRSDRSPTYHLASSVDDVDYEITHVVRGEDLLASTPKHILLGEALGGPPIRYAHLSLLHGPDGSKLSKRHGHTALAAYRRAGFLPEAMINYLALLGWSPGDDETIIDRATVVERFDLGSVSRNPAIFDVAKLEWMNGVYIRGLTLSDFVARTQGLVEADLGRELSAAEAAAFAELAPAVQERAKLLVEVPGQVRFLFAKDLSYDPESWDKVMNAPEVGPALDGARERLEGLEAWTVGSIEEALRAMLADAGLSARKGLQPVRVAITGSAVSPPLFESIRTLGRERALRRLHDAVARL